MKRSIKISIITPSYNSVKTIEQAIFSVLNQTYGNIEYVIVDGGSRDGTVDILDKYSSRIKWISEKDDGLYDAANKALAMTTGDYIQFIGSDDCLKDKNVIKKVVEFITQKSEPDIVCTNRIVVDEYNHTQYIQRPNFENVKLNNSVLFWAPHTSMFVKGDLLRKEKFDLRFKMGADYHFILKCFYKYKYKFKYYDFETAYFANNGVSSNTEKRIVENNRILKDLELERFNYGIINKVKKIIRESIIYKFYLKRKIYNMSVVHHCNNPYCRWCSRNSL